MHSLRRFPQGRNRDAGQEVQMPEMHEGFRRRGGKRAGTGRAARREDTGADEEEPKAPPPKKPAKPAKKEEDEETGDEEEAPKAKGKPAPPAKKGEGEAPKKKSMTLVFVLIGILLLFCCGGVGYTAYEFMGTIKGWIGLGAAAGKKLDAGANVPKGTEVEKEKEKEKELPKADFVAEPAELSGEFQKNFQAAIKKHNNKAVETTGNVKGIGYFPADKKIGVILSGGKVGGKDFQLSFLVNADDPSLFRLSTGQKVKAVGKFYTYLGENISFKDSVIVEIGKSDIKEYTSIKFAEDFDKDTVAADPKYRGKAFLLAGEVLESSKDKFGAPVATMTGSGKTKLKISGATVGYDQVNGLTIGKSVVIRVEDFTHIPAQEAVYLTRAAITTLEPGKTPN
jgi:flagellar basal body-associated protein FliL